MRHRPRDDARFSVAYAAVIVAAGLVALTGVPSSSRWSRRRSRSRWCRLPRSPGRPVGRPGEMRAERHGHGCVVTGYVWGRAAPARVRGRRAGSVPREPPRTRPGDSRRGARTDGGRRIRPARRIRRARRSA